jgi:hypothetical protein
VTGLRVAAAGSSVVSVSLSSAQRSVSSLSRWCARSPSKVTRGIGEAVLWTATGDEPHDLPAGA